MRSNASDGLLFVRIDILVELAVFGRVRQSKVVDQKFPILKPLPIAERTLEIQNLDAHNGD